MEPIVSVRCPRCGNPVTKSNLKEYAYQCVDCDEDFYDFEVDHRKVSFMDVTDIDKQEFEESGLHLNYDEYVHVEMVATDRGDEIRAKMFMKKSDIEKLGSGYVADHTNMTYSAVLESWFGKLSQNDYYNDLQRNPEKVIPVKFVEVENGTGREVYRGLESGRYYLREVSGREPFAKWFVCGKRRMIDDGDEPRANLIFQLGDQTEKVTYDDWNGVCAYSNTFNPKFRPSQG